MSATTKGGVKKQVPAPRIPKQDGNSPKHAPENQKPQRRPHLQRPLGPPPARLASAFRRTDDEQVRPKTQNKTKQKEATQEGPRTGVADVPAPSAKGERERISVTRGASIHLSAAKGRRHSLERQEKGGGRADGLTCLLPPLRPARGAGPELLLGRRLGLPDGRVLGAGHRVAARCRRRRVGEEEEGGVSFFYCGAWASPGEKSGWWWGVGGAVTTTTASRTLGAWAPGASGGRGGGERFLEARDGTCHIPSRFFSLPIRAGYTK